MPLRRIERPCGFDPDGRRAFLDGSALDEAATSYARDVRIHRRTVWSMIGPNRAAAFNRGPSRALHIECTHLFELITTALIFK
jgi:hypothetical protein